MSQARSVKIRELALASMALAALLPGCPLTDHYYIERASGAGGPPATAGAAPALGGNGGTGGTLDTAGTSDGVGGAAASADSAGGTPDTDLAGANATGGDSAGATDATGGSTLLGGTGGSFGNGGSVSTAGDATATGGSVAGGPGAGSGGSVANAGSGSGGDMTTTAGSSSMAGSANSAYQPLCDDSVVKDADCTAASTRFCYRTCGPNSVGYKSETCEQGSYDESDCAFPDSADYSCYKIPYRLPAACPAATIPESGDACQTAACTVCYGGSTQNPLYADSSGTQKSGYCVCSDTGSWTCASTTAWPCPGANGCD